MHFLIHVNIISMGPPIVYFKGTQVRFFFHTMINLSLNVVLILANSADPDEMQHHAAFHLGLHCVQNNPFSGGVSTILTIHPSPSSSKSQKTLSSLCIPTGVTWYTVEVVCPMS